MCTPLRDHFSDDDPPQIEKAAVGLYRNKRFDREIGEILRTESDILIDILCHRLTDAVKEWMDCSL